MNRRNSWWFSGLLAVWLGSIGFSSAFGADAMSPLEKIVVSKGVVYTCSHGKPPLPAPNGGIFLHSWNLGQAKAACSQELGVTVDSTLHWSIAYQYYWVTDGGVRFFGARSHPMHYHCNRVAFDPKTGFPDPVQAMKLARLITVQPLDDLAWIGSRDSKFPVKLHYDYLAVSDSMLQVFILTNVRGRFEFPEVGRSRTLDLTEEERKTPKWSLTVYSNKVTSDTLAKISWTGGRGNGWKRLRPRLRRTSRWSAARTPTTSLPRPGRCTSRRNRTRARNARWTNCGSI